MIKKSDKQLLLEVQLDWLSDTKGVLSANDAKEVTGTIRVGTHPQLGGDGEPWSAQHLFLGAINSCVMSTYLSLAEKHHLDTSHFVCNSIGEVQMVDGKYRLVNINLYPKVYIIEEAKQNKAEQVLQEACQNSMIINAVNTDVFFHGEVLIDPHPRFGQSSIHSNFVA